MSMKSELYMRSLPRARAAYYESELGWRQAQKLGFTVKRELHE